MPSQLDLLNVQQIASVIGVAAYVLLYISTQQSKQEEIQKLLPAGGSPVGSTESQTTAISSWLRFLTFFLLAIVAIIRLEQRLAEPPAARQAAPITPISNIAIGGIIATIGSYIVAVGAQQRAEEPSPPVAII